MDVSAAVATRKSVRAFSDRPVPTGIVRTILEEASRAPSGANFQPWRVYALLGRARDNLVHRVKSKLTEFPRGEGSEFNIHPPELFEPYHSRYMQASSRLYGAAGIAREDTVARLSHLARNWEFYGAPVGLIFTIHRRLEPGQWADLGMYMQTIMLLARSHGLDTCAQEAWALWPKTVRECLSISEEDIVACGMALGHADHSAPINGFDSDRAPFQEYATIFESIDAQ